MMEPAATFANWSAVSGASGAMIAVAARKSDTVTVASFSGGELGVAGVLGEDVEIGALGDEVGVEVGLEVGVGVGVDVDASTG